MDSMPTPRPNPAPRWAIAFLMAFALIVFDPVAGLILHSMAPTSSALPDPSATGSPMLELQARYAIGAEALTKKSVAETAFGPKPADYRKLAGESQIDRARVIPMVYEIYGANAGKDELALFRADYPSMDEGIAQEVAVFETIIEGGSVDEASRQRVIDRHGFFGELAVSAIEGDADAAAVREGLVERAKAFAIRLIAFGGVAVVAGVIGFVLMVLFIILFANGTWRTRFGRELRETPSHDSNWVMAETVAVFLSAFFAYKLVGTLLAGFLPEVVLLGGQFALAALVFWPAVRLGSLKKAAALLGWSRGEGVFTEIGLGIAAYLAGIPVVAVGFVLALVLISAFGTIPTHPVTESIPGGGVLDLVLLYSLACLWAPIVEETIFRGAFYRGVRVQVPGRMGVFLAYAMTSFIFAAIHPQGILFVPVLMGLAIVFAFMREWRGTIVPNMFAHAMHNATIVTLIVVLFGA